MKLPRRKFLHLAAGATALPAVSRAGWAQTYPAQAYPARPVRLIVPFAAGAVNDMTARLIGQWLSERLGQQFLIDNRPGGGGNIGIEAAVRAPADGYTLLVTGTTAAINATLFEKLNYNFIRDIAPVASIVRVPHVMQVNRRFRSRPFPSSSPMPRPIPARSAWARAVTGAQPMSSANCSR